MEGGSRREINIRKQGQGGREGASGREINIRKQGQGGTKGGRKIERKKGVTTKTYYTGVTK